MAGKAILLLSLVHFVAVSYSLPLSTNERWIVDAKSGNRFKLTCVNWAAHLQAMLAEGLDKKPLSYIASQVSVLDFNCVRLTWATFMFTRYAKLTVAQSFDDLNLTEAKAGIAKHNYFLLKLNLVQAYEAVVNELGAHGLLVVLDKHVSQPKWCCLPNDGNGFFGDAHFNPQEWIRGLTTVAKHFKGKSQVVAISLRNELRGARQNEHDWYRYIHEGATKVHKANPEVLGLVSGLFWASDLSFLKKKPLGLNLHNKLVYETHWYSFSGDPLVWEEQPLNRICADKAKTLFDQAGFVNSGENPVPLFLGEFGIDQRGVSKADNLFLTCFLAFAAETDIDWGLWALQGSYYLREGQIGTEEFYGLMNFHWNHFRNPRFNDRLSLIKTTIQDPNSKFSSSYLMYHPQSGSCVHANEELRISAINCWKRSWWSHKGDRGPIKLMASAFCLKVVGDGLAPMLSSDCLSQQASWRLLSSSRLHLAAKDRNGEYLCLHKKYSNSSKIMTSKCICINDYSNCLENPESQWFKLVPTNVK